MTPAACPQDDIGSRTKYGALLSVLAKWRLCWWLPGLLIALAAFLARGISLAIPPLLDEQFWLSWTGAVGSAAAPWAPYLLWQGFSSTDLWGPLTPLLFYCGHALSFGALPVERLLGIVVHAVSAYLLFLALRNFWSDFWLALTAAVLFCLFPLNAEAVSWFGGRGAELCGFFFIAAVYAYQKARRLDGEEQKTAGLNWPWLIGSLLLYLASLLSSALAYSGCLFFVFYESFNWWSKRNSGQKADGSFAVIGPLLFILATVAVVAGTTSLLRLIYAAAPTFSFAAVYSTVKALIFPINEAIWHGYARQYRILYFLLVPYSILFLIALKVDSRLRRQSLFACLWLAIVVLPVCGHVATDADMFGSRHLYLAAMPFAALLAIFFSASRALFRSRQLVGLLIASLGLLVLSGVYLAHGWNQDAAYRNGGRVLHNVQKSLRIVQAKTNAPYVLVRDVPPYVAVSPAFSTDGLVVFDTQSGLLAARHVCAGRLKEDLRAGKYTDIALQWEPDTHALRPLDLYAGKAEFPASMTAGQVAARFMPSLDYYKSDYYDAAADQLILDSNSESGPVVRLTADGLGPLSGDFIYIDAQIDSPPSSGKPLVELYWQTPLHLNYDERERKISAPAIINDGKLHRYLLPLSTIGYLTSGPLNSITIGFPAGAKVKLKSLGLLAKTDLVPGFDVDISKVADSGDTGYVPPFKNYPQRSDLGLYVAPWGADKLPLTYDISKIAAAAGVTVEVSMPFQDFPNPNGNEYSGVGFKTATIMTGQPGQIALTDLPSVGVYAMRAVAVDKDGHPLSAFSDAIYVLVRSVGLLPQEN